MPTNQPLPTFQIEQLKKQLEEMHSKLREEEIYPPALAVVLLSSTEMIFGEVLHDGRYAPETAATPGHGSLSSGSNFVQIKNPKRFTRYTRMSRETSEIAFEFRMADFDYVEAGVVEFKHQGGFFLDNLDEISQLNYCNAYLNFLEGRRRARAKDAGIELVGAATAKQILEGGR